MAVKCEFLIALGGNQPTDAGPPAETIEFSLAQLEHESITVVKVSRLYRTPCFPVDAGPDYVNAAAAIHTYLDAVSLLELLHKIEAGFGRKRTKRWGQRTLDIDLIGMGDAVVPNIATYQKWRDLDIKAQMQIAPSELILPHPRLHERAFVLIPLLDVNPHWMHPVLDLTVAEMCAQLPETDRKAVKLL